MPDTDQRHGTDRRDADHRSGTGTRGLALGRTAVTGWALIAALCVAGVGSAMAAPGTIPQPAPVADTVEAGAAADPTAMLPGAFLGPVLSSLGTATAPSTPTGTATGTATETGGSAGPVTGTVPTAEQRQTAFTTDAPDERARVAIRTALAQMGLPYVWGGNGPTNGDAGFDCSGLTTFSYAAAGVGLPRTAHTQYNKGPHVPAGAALQPGDLVFYGTTARVHHVGMYLGAGRMVNAPTFGKPVRIAFYRYRGDDYLGATRPAAAPGSLTTGFLPFVEPPAPGAVPPPAPQEQVFQAPVATLPAVLPEPGDPTLPSEQESAAAAIAESDQVALTTARSGSVAGTTTSSSAPITTTADGASTTGTATSTTATSTTATSTTATSTTAAPPAGTTAAVAPPAGTTTSSAAPVTTSTTTAASTTTVSAPSTTTRASASVTATTPVKAAVTSTTAPTSTATTTTTTSRVVTTTTAPSTSRTTSESDDAEDEETETSTKTSTKDTPTTEASSSDDAESSDESSESSDESSESSDESSDSSDEN